MSDESWTEKYRPEDLGDLQGNTKASKYLRKWVKNFSQGDQPQLLVGEPGVGKTSCVQAISNELGVPLLEVNASEARRTAEINEFVRDAFTSPFDSDKQIVMFDEADSMSGRTNFDLMYKLLDEAPNPVVFIANEEWEVPKGIKNKCEKHKFNLGTRSIKAKLKKIIKEEDIDVGASTLTRLSQRESLRDAIHDLQGIAEGEEIQQDQRQYESSVFDEVDNAIKGKDVNFSETPPDVLLWMDQNIRDRWRLLEAYMGWECLSLSDKWLGRVKGSDYSWWKYAGSLQSQLPNLRLSDAYDGYIDKSRPEKMKRGWGRGVEGDLYGKLSGADDNVFKMGVDFYTFKTRYIPLLEDLTEEEKFEIALEHNLTDSELERLGADSDEYEEWRESGRSEAEEQQHDEGEVSSFMDW
jgi:replication factor C large subunit